VLTVLSAFNSVLTTHTCILTSDPSTDPYETASQVYRAFCYQCKYTAVTGTKRGAKVMGDQSFGSGGKEVRGLGS